jgi:hypothetical protein
MKKELLWFMYVHDLSAAEVAQLMKECDPFGRGIHPVTLTRALQKGKVFSRRMNALVKLVIERYGNESSGRAV